VNEEAGTTDGLPADLSYETEDGSYSIRITRIEGPLYRVEEVGYADDEAGKHTVELLGRLLDLLERDGTHPRLHICADYTRYRGNSDQTRKLLLRNVIGRPSFGPVVFFGKGAISRVVANLLGVVVPGIEARAFRDEAAAMAHARTALRRDRGARPEAAELPSGGPPLVQLMFERIRGWRQRQEAGFGELVVPRRKHELVELVRRQHDKLRRHELAIGELVEIIARISADPDYDSSALEPPRKIAEDDAYWTIYAALHVLINDMAELLADRERQAAELTRAKEAAEAANRARTEFLGTLGHELRLPLSTIAGLAPLLVIGGLTPEQQLQVDGIRAAANRMARMMQDLLDFARMEAGALRLEPAPFDLHEGIEETLRRFARQAEKRGLALEWHCHDDLPMWVVGDRVRLLQVLGNLVENAVKYTEAGRVRVVVARGTGDEMAFAVSDTGKGIHEEHLPRIFERFDRGEGEGTGSGLGLPISRQLVQLMGGELTVESQPGEGSTFRFGTNLPEAPEPTARGEGRLSVAEELESMRVLLAEDDPMSRYVTSTVLRRVGCQVVVVDDGRQAVERFADDHFDLVLLDCRMPQMDGYAVAREIRRIEGDGSRTPIVALTASALDRDRERAFEAGMDGHVAKPIAPDRLVEVLIGHVGERS